MYVKRIRTTKECVRQEQQRGENERKRGNFVWPTGKMKSPYEQVTSTVKTNVAAIQWKFNEGENNEFPVYDLSLIHI